MCDRECVGVGEVLGLGDVGLFYLSIFPVQLFNTTHILFSFFFFSSLLFLCEQVVKRKQLVLLYLCSLFLLLGPSINLKLLLYGQVEYVK